MLICYKSAQVCAGSKAGITDCSVQMLFLLLRDRNCIYPAFIMILHLAVLTFFYTELHYLNLQLFVVRILRKKRAIVRRTVGFVSLQLYWITAKTSELIRIAQV